MAGREKSKGELMPEEMMTKMKKKKKEETEERLKEDRISQLPDPLICHILSHLPVKDMVTTSLLSTRWTSLWLWVPRLKLDYEDFQNFDDFMSFGDRFFDSNRASCIEKVEFTIVDYSRFVYGVDDEFSYLTSWIDAAVKRKIQHLHVCCDSDELWYYMPLRLYTCETLVSLKLYQVSLDDVEFVCLPCLKTMHLKSIWYRKKMDSIFERLIGCCPVLEKLKIVVGCDSGKVNIFRMFSRSLKKLIIKLENVYQDVCFGFVIDAPRLRFLSINDKVSHSFEIDDMESNVKVDISLPHGLDDIDEASFSLRRSNIHSFLSRISKVRDLTICSDIFKLICQYSKKEPLPQFGYMSRLRVTLLVSDLHWLPTFLESCPNLKSLILVWDSNSTKMYFKELSRFNFSSVPECLLSSLEFVDIKTSMSGHFAELKLVRYFLASSTILKKLTLRLNHYCANEKYIVRDILSIPRRSNTCQVVIH